MKKKVKFLITGHPRTGTHSMARLFQKSGFDVKHERIGENGVCSWMYAVDADSVPFGSGRRKDIDPEYLLLVVRDPVSSISAILLANKIDASYNYRSNYIDIEGNNKYEEAISAYFNWVELIEEQNPDEWFNIEEANQQVYIWLKREGFDVGLVPKTPHLGKSGRPRMRWGRLKQEISEEYEQKVVDFCDKYNYVIKR